MTSEHEYSVEDEINDVGVTRPHVVILGAGASLAAFPSGDRNGRRLPLMLDFVETVGLGPILDRHNINYTPGENFEDLYSGLHEAPEHSSALHELETAVQSYFSQFQLPDQPTIYDHLVLSLRDKDVIATFNWDPFLYNACYRNHRRIKSLPHVAYLHGSVAIGYCQKDKRKGVRGGSCSICRKPFIGTQLLYPVKEKNYNSDPFIQGEWSALVGYLEHGYLLTIFGYGAPSSDIEAIELMHTAWGEPSERSLEEIEIIDVKPKDELLETWSPFIHTHHYEVQNAFYDSWIAKHPRRSCEAAIAQFINAKFIDVNPLPRNADFTELWSWYDKLTKVE